MKKLIALILVGITLLSLCACSNNQTSSDAPKQESIALTKDNISEYIQFSGEFINGTHTMSFINYAEAVLDFQAYPTASGQFNDVEITLVATSNDHTFTYMNDFGNYWHLSDSDSNTREIKFTFKLGVDGKFSKNYSVECSNNTGNLKGGCDFTVVSVSGTFTPN